MSAIITLYPHRVTRAIELLLSDFDDPLSEGRIVVEKPKPVEVAGSTTTSQVYTVQGEQDHWKRLSFDIEARIPQDQLDWLLPAGTRLSSATRLVVLLTCRSTKFRHGVRLEPHDRGVWRGSVALAREDVVRSVFLTPQLLLSQDIDTGGDSSYATTRSSIIGVGDRIRIDLSRPISGEASPVEVFWEDFESSANPWRRSHAEDVFSLAIEERPVVYLNSRYSELRDILESTAKRGQQAAQRELTAALIAQPVLVQLSSIALLAVESEDDSDAPSIPGGWRGDLVNALIPVLYPGMPNTDVAMRRLAEETRDSYARADLFSRLGSCVQRMISTQHAVETAIRAFEAGRGEVEQPGE